jgi:hypothetical protein
VIRSGGASILSAGYPLVRAAPGAIRSGGARARYGEDDVEVYLFEFTTLELAAAHRQKHPDAVTGPMDEDMPPNSLAKLVCLRSQAERVVGFHFVGGGAGEMTQVRPPCAARTCRRRHPARSSPRPPALCALTERSARRRSRRRGPAPPPRRSRR